MLKCQFAMLRLTTKAHTILRIKLTVAHISREGRILNVKVWSLDTGTRM
jgi:hypothetical protein